MVSYERNEWTFEEIRWELIKNIVFILNEEWNKSVLYNTVRHCISAVYFNTFPLCLIWKRWHFSWKEDFVELVYAHLQMANVENWLSYMSHCDISMNYENINNHTHKMQQKCWKINLVGFFK